MIKPSKNLRTLLTSIGIGGFNATMIIPYMMISPATTDPKASQIVLIVQHIQRALFRLGATDVAESGRLDQPTAQALLQIVGPNWERMPWSASVSAVVTAMETGRKVAPPMSMTPQDETSDAMPVAVGGPLDFLPDVPGGLLTYAIAGYFLYRHFNRSRRAS